MDMEHSPHEVRPGRQLCVLSCQGDGVAYYWSMLDWRARNAVSFRGFSATFQATTVARAVLDFTIRGPLISCLADLQDISQVQAIDLGGSAGAPPNVVPFAVKVLVAPAPFLAPGGRSPHGAMLSLKNEREGTTIATVSDLHRDEDWVFVVLVAAIAAIAVNSGASLIDILMFDSSTGNLTVSITTPIGTVALNKPFSFAPGLPDAEG
jgi:hypothetical protein